MRPLSAAARLQPAGRRPGWECSCSMVALDLVWSLAFVVVSCAVLLSTAGERPPTPVRVWILGYALHCLVHVGFVCFECRGRRSGVEGWVGVGGDEEEEDEGAGRLEDSRQSRFMKKLESISAVASFLWWILGFYWIALGGQALPQDAPWLYWLMVVFLAFDIFFAVICITLACIIGVALFCCLPCIVAILYAVAGQEGASDADINCLPRFRFHKANQLGLSDMDKEHEVSITITENCSPTSDLSPSSEDSVCCICLARYEDGVELHSLPCGHHFHSGCIVKWLRINATCPLCKYNILNGDEQV